MFQFVTEVAVMFGMWSGIAGD